MKTFQLNPDTQLNGKTKELIGLAVAAQIPCQYCIYFHTAAAKANGATDEEIREAVAMAAVARHWSTVLNGMQVDLNGFKRDTDTVLDVAAQKAKAAGRSQ
jgi:AhpD family alkylhydroperoxidase